MDYPEYPIDNRIVFKAEVPKEKTLRFKGMLHSNLPYYSENSIRHPAKMSILLTKWILQKFTKEWETVIDPMSGIGTTLLEAVNMNRNCIAVEFEKKFVDWTNENIILLNKNKPLDRRGKSVILQGDARSLTDILNKQADKIVFSPPYCETEAFHDQDFTLRSTKVNPSSRKISEQKYGKGADVVVTSPPYVNIAKSKEGAISPHMQGLISKLSGIPVKEFTNDVEKLKEAVKIAQSKMPFSYGESPNNIGNLPKGEIDTIITSPPYENTIREGQEGVNVTSDKGRWKREFSGKESPSYFESEDNLGNLKKKSYLSEMKKVYDQCFSVLKHGGLAVLVTKNFVRNYKQVRLDMDTILLMESCGFVLIDRYFRAIEKPSFWILNYRKQCKKKGIPDPTAHFEDITVYKKI